MNISTTSLNVIALVEDDPQLLDWMLEHTEPLAHAHGSRTILLDASQNAQTRRVRTHQTAMGDTMVTSSEQIHLGIDGVRDSDLRGLVHDLLVPNVRCVLLWAGSHVSDERFTALSELADTIVLFSSAQPAAQSLAEIVRLEGTPVAARLRDLTYMRLLVWQDLVAQFFDDPDLASELPAITHIEIRSGSKAEGYYLLGWLASRLGWEPAGPDEFRNAQGNRVTSAIRLQGPPRRIRSVQLRAPHCLFGAAIHPESDDLLCLSVDGRKRRPQRCLPLHDVDVVSLVERAIFSPASSDVYMETLRMVRRLLEQT